MSHRAGGRFPGCYLATRLTRYWRQNICVQMDARFSLWNHRDFDKLVFYSYPEATGYLGRYRENQNTEQRHCKLFDLVLRRKLCEAIRFFCKQELGGVLQPNKLASDKKVIMEETVA